jgi:hypothetical protein
LQNIVNGFGVEVSPEKPETMACLRQDPVRCKIVVENKCLQQVKMFNISVVQYPVNMKQTFNRNWENFLKNWKF